MPIFVRQRTSQDLNLTVYDDTKFSSPHVPYTNTILHLVISYDFQSYRKLFQAGNINVNKKTRSAVLQYTRDILQRITKKYLRAGENILNFVHIIKQICLMKFYEDQCCTSCFESEGTKHTECSSYRICTYFSEIHIWTELALIQVR